jgi:rRNA maturation endonuclease Nob1
MKTCQACFAMTPPALTTCDHCGHIFGTEVKYEPIQDASRRRSDDVPEWITRVTDA